MQSSKSGRKRLFVRVSRLMNYGCVALMLADATLRLVLGFQQWQGISFYLISVALVFFATLFLAAEIRYGRMLDYIAFLRGRAGKGIYLLLVGVLTFDDARNTDAIIGVTLFLIGIFNILVACMRDDVVERAEPCFEKDYGSLRKDVSD